MHSSSPRSSTPSSNLSFASIFQYAVFAVVVYVLAGAPLTNMLGGGGAASYSTTRRTSSGQSGQSASHEKLESLVIPEDDLVCADHAYRGVHILSREPLVVYIEGFVSDEESDHVVRLSEPHFTPSTIWTGGTETLDTSIRHSEKAPLPRDHTVKCIEDRARKFQGWRPYTFIEKLWSQRYGTGGHYTYHYDWSTATRVSGRVSSFMVYLDANCTGGGTHFPRLEKPAVGDEWCRFVECGETGAYGGEQADLLSKGVIFKPIRGNAVYWENMRADGSGYAESWHAGLPVTSGVKIGLNIWSWWQEGYVPEKKQAELK